MGRVTQDRQTQEMNVMKDTSVYGGNIPWSRYKAACIACFPVMFSGEGLTQQMEKNLTYWVGRV